MLSYSLRCTSLSVHLWNLRQAACRNLRSTVRLQFQRGTTLLRFILLCFRPWFLARHQSRILLTFRQTSLLASLETLFLSHEIGPFKTWVDQSSLNEPLVWMRRQYLRTKDHSYKAMLSYWLTRIETPADLSRRLNKPAHSKVDPAMSHLRFGIPPPSEDRSISGACPLNKNSTI